MTAYNDVPRVNELYEEQSRVADAITMLDAGGTISMFMVSPPLPAAGPTPMMINPRMTNPTPMMAVQISTVDPSPALLATTRAALVDRHNAITEELIKLGVTASPPKAT